MFSIDKIAFQNPFRVICQLPIKNRVVSNGFKHMYIVNFRHLTELKMQVGNAFSFHNASCALAMKIALPHVSLSALTHPGTSKSDVCKFTLI